MQAGGGGSNCNARANGTRLHSSNFLVPCGHALRHSFLLSGNGHPWGIARRLLKDHSSRLAVFSGRRLRVMSWSSLPARASGRVFGLLKPASH